MTPRERLYPERDSDCDPRLAGSDKPRDWANHRHQRASDQNHLRSAFDKLGVWSRLELAMYVASHGGKNWPESDSSPGVYAQAIGAD